MCISVEPHLAVNTLLNVIVWTLRRVEASPPRIQLLLISVAVLLGPSGEAPIQNSEFEALLKSVSAIDDVDERDELIVGYLRSLIFASSVVPWRRASNSP